MFMSDKLFNSTLEPLEKLAIAYFLKGHLRYKYVAREKMADVLKTSNATASKVFKSLEKKGLIYWERVEGKKYKVVIITQECFNLYGELVENDIKEVCCVKDNRIETLGQIEANKPLYLINNDKRLKLNEAIKKIFK